MHRYSSFYFKAPTVRLELLPSELIYAFVNYPDFFKQLISKERPVLEIWLARNPDFKKIIENFERQLGSNKDFLYGLINGFVAEQQEGMNSQNLAQAFLIPSNLIDLINKNKLAILNIARIFCSYPSFESTNIYSLKQSLPLTEVSYSTTKLNELSASLTKFCNEEISKGKESNLKTLKQKNILQGIMTQPKANEEKTNEAILADIDKFVENEKKLIPLIAKIDSVEIGAIFKGVEEQVKLEADPEIELGYTDTLGIKYQKKEDKIFVELERNIYLLYDKRTAYFLPTNSNALVTNSTNINAIKNITEAEYADDSERVREEIAQKGYQPIITAKTRIVLSINDHLAKAQVNFLNIKLHTDSLIVKPKFLLENELSKTPENSRQQQINILQKKINSLETEIRELNVDFEKKETALISVKNSIVKRNDNYRQFLETLINLQGTFTQLRGLMSNNKQIAMKMMNKKELTEAILPSFKSELLLRTDEHGRININILYSENINISEYLKEVGKKLEEMDKVVKKQKVAMQTKHNIHSLTCFIAKLFGFRGLFHDQVKFYENLQSYCLSLDTTFKQIKSNVYYKEIDKPDLEFRNLDSKKNAINTELGQISNHIKNKTNDLQRHEKDLQDLVVQDVNSQSDPDPSAQPSRSFSFNRN